MIIFLQERNGDIFKRMRECTSPPDNYSSRYDPRFVSPMSPPHSRHGYHQISSRNEYHGNFMGQIYDPHIPYAHNYHHYHQHHTRSNTYYDMGSPASSTGTLNSPHNPYGIRQPRFDESDIGSVSSISSS